MSNPVPANLVGDLNDVDAFTGDAIAAAAIAAHAPWCRPHAQRLGQQVWSPVILSAARDAHRHPPELRTHDRLGNLARAVLSYLWNQVDGATACPTGMAYAAIPTLREAPGSGPVRGPGEAYRLNGHKWFCSAPMSDGFFTVARTEAGPGCFFVPRWRPDGTPNGIVIQRLKDKLGKCLVRDRVPRRVRDRSLRGGARRPHHLDILGLHPA